MLNYIWDFFSFLKNVYYYLSQKDRLEKYGFKFAVKNITDRQGRQFGWVGADDGTYGVFKEIADKQVGNPLKGLCDVKELELRDDDVMVCTYPRTGTHWVWEMTSMVMRGVADHDDNPKETYMLELQTPETLAELPSPRILNGHQLPVLLPEQLFTKKIKIIHVYRNPKDVAVSLFHFSKKMPMLLKCMNNKPYETFSEFLPYFTGEYGVFFMCSIFEYYKEMENLINNRPEQALNLCYEEMKQSLKSKYSNARFRNAVSTHQDPVEAVQRIAEFVGKDLSKQLIVQIAEKCSFKNLSTADEHLKQNVTITTLADPGKFGTSEMYRKGEVGDWQNYFTEEENENFDKLTREHFKDSEWKFTYIL